MVSILDNVENKGKVKELAALVHDGLLDENVAASRAEGYNVDRDAFREMVKNYKPDGDKAAV